MTEAEFQRRTRTLAVSVFRLIDEFPRCIAARVVAEQVARSSSSVGANYRAACRARSRAEMISKLHIVQEEADETEHWLLLAVETGYLTREQAIPAIQEAHEIVAMTVSSLLTLKGKRQARED